jgi:hypothetical protein
MRAPPPPSSSDASEPPRAAAAAAASCAGGGAPSFAGACALAPSVAHAYTRSTALDESAKSA